MKSKVLLSILVMFAITASIFAKDVSLSQAEQVAVNFLFQKSNQYGDAIDYYDLNITDSYKVSNSYYVVNFEDGWVIVAADDAMIPVIGYNLEGRMPSVNEYSYNFGSWMQSYTDQVNYIRENNLVADSETTNKWETYLVKDITNLNMRADRDVDPLLTSEWNQDDPWNAMCPLDAAGPGGRVYVGCVATAMSMVMHYWRYPLVGEGSHSFYQYPYGTQSVNFGETEYNWDGMTDQISSKYVWEMAKIGYHAAVSVDMQFSPEGSGAYSADVPGALKSYFGIQSTVQYLRKSLYSSSIWETMLQGELDALRPVYYSGSSTSGGHAFCCDGYQGSDYYHFNFGWSGSGNGFFSLSDVGSYNQNQGMIRNFYPGDPSYPYIASGNTELTTLVGSFTDGSSPAQDYPSGMNASWLINPQNEQDSVTNLKIKFRTFNTDPSDVLKFYDGPNASSPLLGEFSGDAIPSDIYSTSNQVFVTFSSSSSAPGFKVQYESMMPTYCGFETITDAEGTISDGSNDFYYNNKTFCQFTLAHPEAVKYYIDFTSFATEETNDILYVSDANGNTLGEFSGTTIPDALEVETTSISMLWSTNETVRDAGWEFDFHVDGVGVNETSFENLTIYPNPTTGILNINFDTENTGAVSVKFMSVNGQVILNENIDPQGGNYNRSIDISNNAKGVYLLSITSDNEKIDRKIVLK